MEGTESLLSKASGFDEATMDRIALAQPLTVHQRPIEIASVTNVNGGDARITLSFNPKHVPHGRFVVSVRSRESQTVPYSVRMEKHSLLGGTVFYAFRPLDDNWSRVEVYVRIADERGRGIASTKILSLSNKK